MWRSERELYVKSKGWENKRKKVRKKQPRECVEKGKRKQIILQNKHLQYVWFFDFLKVTRMKILFKFLTQEPCNWNYKYYIKLSKVYVDPAFRLMRFHLMASSHFLFWKWFIYQENDLKSLLIFALFFKGKQNKKENTKCDSLFGKDGLWKIGLGFRGQVTYWEGTVKTVAPL